MTIQEKIANKQEERLTFSEYELYFDNKKATLQTIEEVTSDPFYQFISDKEKPFIIDAGSNIGIATLFLKSLNPKADILCIEADPTAFLTLKRNIILNKIKDITLLNAAVSDKAGTCDFFGQITVPSPDARGNSILSQWGTQRKTNNQITVQAVKLSDYIDKEVDFLKLDIEGAEQQVLEELNQAGKLTLIKEITLEVHQIEAIRQINDLDVIITLLESNGFKLDIVEKTIPDVWPDEIKQWVTQNKPELFSINAVRSSLRS